MVDTFIAVLLDANTVLHFPPPDQINWCELTGRKEVVLVIYPLLLREVSNAKDKAYSKTVRRRAADRERWFDERLGDIGNEVRPGVRIEIVDQEPAVDFEKYRLDRKISDDCIIATAIEYREATGHTVAIATRDRGLRLKLRSRGLEVVLLPESQVLPEEPDPDRIARNKAESELRRHLNRLPDLRLFFENGEKSKLFGLPTLEDKEAFFAREMDACRQNYPKRSTPDVGPAMFEEPNALHNEQVDKYYSYYKSFLEKLWVYEMFSITHPKVNLDINNDGTRPATNLRIALMFPDLVRCLPKEEVKEPLRPSALDYSPIGFYGTLPDRRRFNYFAFGPGFNYPQVDDERQTVTYSIGRVGHHSSGRLAASSSSWTRSESRRASTAG